MHLHVVGVADTHLDLISVVHHGMNKKQYKISKSSISISYVPPS